VPPAHETKQIVFLTMAAAYPNKPTQKQLAVATEWALQARAQARLIEHILAKKMTLFPQEDGSILFGGKLLKVAEHREKTAQVADVKARAMAEGKILLDGSSNV
jgi:hypothetical protein